MPQEKSSALRDEVERRGGLEKWTPKIETPEDLRFVLEQACDYRGDVTIATKDGRQVVGYVFNRVQEWAYQHEKKQTPRRVSNLAGEIWLSQNPHLEKQRLDSLHESGQLTDAEYQEAKALLEKGASGLADVEANTLKVLQDLLSATIPVSTYRATIMRVKRVGVLDIRSEPAGATVFLDGKYLGVTPLKLSNQPVGEYLLEFQCKGYEPARRRVQVDAGKTGTIRQTLVRPKPEYGELIVNAVPWGEVYLDGKHRGTTPLRLRKVLVGEHTVKVMNAACQDATRKVTIKKDQIIRLMMELRPE